MKRAILFMNDKNYLNNRVFDIGDKNLNRDDCLYPYFLLKENLKERDIELVTQDQSTFDEAEFILFSDLPDTPVAKQYKQKCYGIIFETELIKPCNWDKSIHDSFNRIFTWHDDFVDGKKYIKINYCHKIPSLAAFDNGQRQKLCTLIAGNKNCRHPLELYSKRLDAIKYFEKNHRDDFDLYGIGWDRLNWGRGVFGKIVRKLQIPVSNRISYQGKVVSKNETLKKYKFCICFENARGIPGYITEKIFDCLFAGTIPVYWGAPNITDFIPKGTFIDFRKFSSFEKLYDFLKKMSNVEYQRMQKNILDFLNSEGIKQFSAEFFVENVVKNICGEKNGKK